MSENCERELAKAIGEAYNHLFQVCGGSGYPDATQLPKERRAELVRRWLQPLFDHIGPQASPLSSMIGRPEGMPETEVAAELREMRQENQKSILAALERCARFVSDSIGNFGEELP